jgi:hypothetical protein
MRAYEILTEGVAGPKKCWPGHRKVGTQPGTGKNAGKRVNDCEKIKEDDVEEGWKDKLAGAALAGTMALGAAGANARVMPGDDPNINRLTGKPIATQQATDNAPAKAEAPKGFSKEYLQKAADPNRFGRYMISVEKAQELLKNMQEGVAEGNMDGKVADIKGQIAELEAEQEENEFGSYAYDTVNGELQYLYAKLDKAEKGVAEAEKKGLYYYVNKRKKAGTSRDASHPKAPTAQAWKDAAKTAKKEDLELEQEFDMIEEVIEYIADQHAVDAELVWEDLSTLTDDELYVFAVTSEMVNEDWQKANKRDKTDGMSRKAVKAYRRENPGSKLKTAVTTKPSKLKKGGKASKRRKSYCSRSRGQMKMHSISCSKTPDKAICKARRRWNC